MLLNNLKHFLVNVTILLSYGFHNFGQLKPLRCGAALHHVRGAAAGKLPYTSSL
jgi:hypothetical protein